MVGVTTVGQKWKPTMVGVTTVDQKSKKLPVNTPNHDHQFKVNSSTDDAKIQNNSSLKLLERIASEFIACMVKKSDFEVRNIFCYQPL